MGSARTFPLVESRTSQDRSEGPYVGSDVRGDADDGGYCAGVEEEGDEVCECGECGGGSREVGW